MKTRFAIKILIDVFMTAILLLLMAYEMIGQAFHEWAGCAMFILFLAHHALNGKWVCTLFKGKYSIYRAFQTILVVAVLFCMVGSMVSGIVLSQTVFKALYFRGAGWARTMHMLCAYWGFVLMSMHLGLHCVMMAGIVKKALPDIGKTGRAVLRLAAAGLAIYGVCAFIRRDIPAYLSHKNHFAFFDFGEPLIIFLLDYAAIMLLFATAGHYIGVFLRKTRRSRKADKA